MQKIFAIFLIITFIATAGFAFAADSPVDCDCKNGGLGIKLGGFICGFGFKTFNSLKGCDKTIGIGLGIGGEDGRLQLGFGLSEGVFGLGIGIKGSDTTTVVGFSIGYNYGDCRMVWPYEE